LGANLYHSMNQNPPFQHYMRCEYFNYEEKKKLQAQKMFPLCNFYFSESSEARNFAETFETLMVSVLQHHIVLLSKEI
jgi:hypothetical protein